MLDIRQYKTIVFDCDGVVLNYVVSVDYIRRAVALVEKGAQKVGKCLADVDRPELLVCCLSDKDPQAAISLSPALLQVPPRLDLVEKALGWDRR